MCCRNRACIAQDVNKLSMSISIGNGALHRASNIPDVFAPSVLHLEMRNIFYRVLPGLKGVQCLLQGDPFDWWVTFMYFVGDCLWFVATSFQIIEALNTGWDTRYFEWQRDGCKGPPPR